MQNATLWLYKSARIWKVKLKLWTLNYFIGFKEWIAFNNAKRGCLKTLKHLKVSYIMQGNWEMIQFNLLILYQKKQTKIKQLTYPRSLYGYVQYWQRLCIVPITSSCLPQPVLNYIEAVCFPFMLGKMSSNA
jgi:hypothetical protein